MSSIALINAQSTKNPFEKIDEIRPFVAREAVFIASRTGLMAVAASYHFTMGGLKTFPLTVRLALSTIPLNVVERLASCFGTTTVADLQDHIEHGWQAIKLAVSNPFSASSHSRSKQLCEALIQVKCLPQNPTQMQKVLGYANRAVDRKIVTAKELAFSTIGIICTGVIAFKAYKYKIRASYIQGYNDRDDTTLRDHLMGAMIGVICGFLAGRI